MGDVVLLTVKEYAALFRKHPKTIYRRINSPIGADGRPEKFTRFEVERDGNNILIAVPATMVERLQRKAQQSTSVSTFPR